jgi:hypothetical protein
MQRLPPRSAGCYACKSLGLPGYWTPRTRNSKQTPQWASTETAATTCTAVLPFRPRRVALVAPASARSGWSPRPSTLLCLGYTGAFTARTSARSLYSLTADLSTCRSSSHAEAPHAQERRERERCPATAANVAVACFHTHTASAFNAPTYLHCKHAVGRTRLSLAS